MQDVLHLTIVINNVNDYMKRILVNIVHQKASQGVSQEANSYLERIPKVYNSTYNTLVSSMLY